MNSKTKALTLLAVIVIAAVAGSLIYVSQSIAKADTTISVAADSETTSLSSVNATDNVPNSLNEFCNGPIATGMEHRLGLGHRGMGRGFGVGFGLGALEVSADFIANVTNIAKSDSDVQNLLNQRYNITSIHPVITTTIDGNGNVVTQASTSNVFLQGDNGSRSFVVIDLSQAKVTKIVTLTVTEIDK